MISLGSLRSPGSGRVGQLLRQTQFDIKSCQICDAKFQCLHISQRYLRSNRCETTLINLIKLSVCPKHTSPHSSPEREENPCPAMPCCAIYQPPPAATWLHLRFSKLLRLLASSLLTHFRAARCNMNTKDSSQPAWGMQRVACSMRHIVQYTVRSTTTDVCMLKYRTWTLLHATLEASSGTLWHDGWAVLEGAGVWQECRCSSSVWHSRNKGA